MDFKLETVAKDTHTTSQHRTKDQNRGEMRNANTRENSIIFVQKKFFSVLTLNPSN